MFELDKFQVPPTFRGKSPFIVQLWWCVQATLFTLSPRIYVWLASFLLRLFGAKIGKGVVIGQVSSTYPWKVAIGDYSWVGDDVVLSLGQISIGSNSVVSQKSVCLGSHDYESQTFDIYAKTYNHWQ